MADEEAEQETEQQEESSEQEEAAEQETQQEDEAKVKPDDDWRQKARKHETRAKREARERAAEKKRADELAAKLAAYEDRDKSEHEKAVEEALAKGRAEAETKYQQELRKRDLELAVTKIAASKGVKVGTGDDAKTVRFADPDIVQMWVERQLVQGGLSGDDLFAEGGKVNQDALAEALAELAEDKPFLLVGAGNGGGRRAAGDPDAGKGKGSSRTLDDMSPDEHYKMIRGRT